MMNAFNNFIYNPQPAQSLEHAFQQKLPPLKKPDILSFVAPSHQALCYVQPDPKELPPTGQRIQYGPPTIIFQKPQPRTQNIMGCFVPSYQDQCSIQPNLKEKPPIVQSVEYACPLPIYPPLSKAPEFPYALTRVDMMDIEQTGNWVSTLGRYMGWEEAEAYAKKFKDNGVTGDCLRKLTHELLKFDLGMTKESHRIELLRNIQLLYPQNTTREADWDPVLYSLNTTPTKIFQSPREVVYDHSPPRAGYDCIRILNQLVQPEDSNRSQMDTESESGNTHCNISTCSTNGVGAVYMDCRPVLDSGYLAEASESCSPGKERSYAEVVLGSGKDGLSMPGMTARKSECVTNNYDDPMLQKREEASYWNSRRVGYRKLIVTLRPDQLRQDHIAIRRRFAEFNFLVDVKKWEESDSTYLVVFPNSQKAWDAFEMAEDLGYNLKRKWPDRPNPKRPIKYISKRMLLIREGKAFSGKEVGKLGAYEIVTVNQVKGRRARMIKVVDGEVKNIGWVSLSTNDGVPLLEQVSEVYEPSCNV